MGWCITVGKRMQMTCGTTRPSLQRALPTSSMFSSSCPPVHHLVLCRERDTLALVQGFTSTQWGDSVQWEHRRCTD